MKYLFLFFLLCVSFFDLSAAVEGDANNASTSEKRKIDEPKGQKMEIESITWIGGWGLEMEHRNETEQKMPIDFDRITLTVKNKDFSGTYQIPFSFKGVIPSRDSNSYIIPLHDLDLPAGQYSLALVFEKNKGAGKGVRKKNQFVSVLNTAIPEFVAPPEVYKKVSQVKESDVLSHDKGCLVGPCEATVKVHYYPFSKEGDLFIRMRTEIASVDKTSIGKKFSPNSKGESPYIKDSAQPYRTREHTALARLKITITTGKELKTIYYPLPVYFSLPAGERCEFTVCLKKMEWDEKKSHMEVEHLVAPEGHCMNTVFPFSKMIFHKEANT